MAKTASKVEKKKEYPVMGEKEFASRSKTPMPKQTTQSAQPASQKPKMGAKVIKHGSGKPTGKNIAKSVAKKDCY